MRPGNEPGNEDGSGGPRNEVTYRQLHIRYSWSYFSDVPDRAAQCPAEGHALHRRVMSLGDVIWVM